MSDLIDRFKPRDEVIQELREFSLNHPELKEVFDEADYNLKRILKLLENVPDDHPLKDTYKKVLPVLITKDLEINSYKYAHFKALEERKMLAVKAHQYRNEALQYKEAFEKTAKRNNDYGNIKDIKNYVYVEVETQKPLSEWRQHSISKLIQDEQMVNDIISAKRVLTPSDFQYSDKRRGPRMDNVNRVTVTHKKILSDKDET
jgi:hypothetical protein